LELTGLIVLFNLYYFVVTKKKFPFKIGYLLGEYF